LCLVSQAESGTDASHVLSHWLKFLSECITDGYVNIKAPHT
jgi:hypothetical protein